MNDELKIIIKAILDENTESSINQQLKNLKIEPLSLDIKIDSKTNSQISKVKKELNDIVSRKINKNSLAKSLIQNFGISNKLDKNEIKKAAEEYQNALKVNNPSEISKSYDKLFDSIKNSFYNFTHEISSYEKEYLNFLKGTKFYISDAIKEDLGEDDYKYYRDNLIGKITRNRREGVHSDTFYDEINEVIPGILPRIDFISEQESFRNIVDTYIDLRNKAKAKFDQEDILWNFGTDEDIKNSINKVINEFENQKPKFERSIKN